MLKKDRPQIRKQKGMLKMEKKPVMLMILDGFGINEKTDGGLRL